MKFMFEDWDGFDWLVVAAVCVVLGFGLLYYLSTN